MLPCLSTKLPKVYMEGRMYSIVRCASCHTGFFKENKCPSCFKKTVVRKIEKVEVKKIEKVEIKKIEKVEEAKNIRIIEYVKVVLSYPKRPRSKGKKKSLWVKRVKSVEKKCSVCGEPSGRRTFCSEVCRIRKGSSWYGENGIEYISVEIAIERLVKNKARREAKKIKHDSENTNT